MRHILTAILFLPAPAFAHPWHLGDVAGHDHWIAGAAVCIALGAGLWQVSGKRRALKTEEAEAEVAETAA